MTTQPKADRPRALKVYAAPPSQPAEPTIDEQVASVNAVFDAWRNGEDATLTLGLAAQPAEPVEPVAKIILDTDGECGVEWIGHGDGLIVGAKLYYRAQPAPAAVPPGYALVPIEPTPEMIDAGLGKLLYVASPQPRHIYRAMIAAAGDNT